MTDTISKHRDSTPQITHELLELHMRRARHLRSQAVRAGLQRGWRWLAQGLRTGRGRKLRHAH